MRKIRAVMRLHASGQSNRAIATSLSISRQAVAEYLTRAASARLSWPLPDDLSDADLENRLFPVVLTRPGTRRSEPDWPVIRVEMKRKGATLSELHREYLEKAPDGIGYSLFCDRFREFEKTLQASMRQVYKAGDRVFVDYAGPTIRVMDKDGQKERHAQVFVGVLGASNYIYAEAHWSQTKPDWIAAHARMFAHFGGVPNIVVCDNLKSAVKKASRTEPEINESYQHMAGHYNTLILPGRAYKPKDKAKAENGVLIVERWILFRLRKRLFTNLREVNDAIQALLVDVNARPFKKLPGTRQSAFEQIDLPALQPLPASPFEYTEFHKGRVGADYRVKIGEYTLSVPSTLIRQVVEIRISASALEILHGGRRIWSYERIPGKVVYEDPAHMPANHRALKEWSLDSALAWAREIGPHLPDFIARALKDMRAYEQGYRLQNSLQRMVTKYGEKRVDAACCRAIEIGALKPSHLRNLLENHLEQQSAPDARWEANFEHQNIRGANYYH